MRSEQCRQENGRMPLPMPQRAHATHGASSAARPCHTRRAWRDAARGARIARARGAMSGRGHFYPPPPVRARPPAAAARTEAHTPGWPEVSRLTAPSPWERVASPCFQEGYVVVAADAVEGRAELLALGPGGVAQAMGHMREAAEGAGAGRARKTRICAHDSERASACKCASIRARPRRADSVPRHARVHMARRTHARAHISHATPLRPGSQARRRANTALRRRAGVRVAGSGRRRRAAPRRARAHAWRG